MRGFGRAANALGDAARIAKMTVIGCDRRRRIRAQVDADLFAVMPASLAAHEGFVPRSRIDARCRAAALAKDDAVHVDAQPLARIRHARQRLDAGGIGASEGARLVGARFALPRISLARAALPIGRRRSPFGMRHAAAIACAIDGARGRTPTGARMHADIEAQIACVVRRCDAFTRPAHRRRTRACGAARETRYARTKPQQCSRAYVLPRAALHHRAFKPSPPGGCPHVKALLQSPLKRPSGFSGKQPWNKFMQPSRFVSAVGSKDSRHGPNLPSG